MGNVFCPISSTGLPTNSLARSCLYSMWLAGEEPGNEAKLVTVAVTLQEMWVKPIQGAHTHNLSPTAPKRGWDCLQEWAYCGHHWTNLYGFHGYFFFIDNLTTNCHFQNAMLLEKCCVDFHSFDKLWNQMWWHKPRYWQASCTNTI